MKSFVKNSDEKPSFHAGKKINYFKDDLRIYSQIDDKNFKEPVKTKRTNNRRGEDIDDILQNLNPLK